MQGLFQDSWPRNFDILGRSPNLMWLFIPINSKQMIFIKCSEFQVLFTNKKVSILIPASICGLFTSETRVPPILSLSWLKSKWTNNFHNNFLISQTNPIVWPSLDSLYETISMSGHTIRFGREKWKLAFLIHLFLDVICFPAPLICI